MWSKKDLNFFLWAIKFFHQIGRIKGSFFNTLLKLNRLNMTSNGITKFQARDLSRNQLLGKHCVVLACLCLCVRMCICVCRCECVSVFVCIMFVCVQWKHWVSKVWFISRYRLLLVWKAFMLREAQFEVLHASIRLSNRRSTAPVCLQPLLYPPIQPEWSARLKRATLMGPAPLDNYSTHCGGDTEIQR